MNNEIFFTGGNGSGFNIRHSHGYCNTEVQVDWGEIICLMRQLLMDDSGCQCLNLYKDTIDEIRIALNERYNKN